MFGPWAQTSVKSKDVPPFYISLRIHGMFLHNAMFDSGASHNLILKIIMDNLGLDITQPYKDLFSFDSRELRCLGLTKELVVVLHQIPEKSLVMGMVVVDVPPKFGMLFSRSWETKLKGTLQMDLYYATIPIFDKKKILYRENHLAYTINNKEKPENHPVYSIDTDMGSSMLFNNVYSKKSEPRPSESANDEPNQQSVETEEKHEPNDVSLWPKERNEGWWYMDFDGLVSKEGAGARIWIRPFQGEPKLFCYKIYFDCTNNVAKYEALFLALRVLKDLNAKNIHIWKFYVGHKAS